VPGADLCQELGFHLRPREVLDSSADGACRRARAPARHVDELDVGRRGAGQVGLERHAVDLAVEVAAESVLQRPDLTRMTEGQRRSSRTQRTHGILADIIGVQGRASSLAARL
jgi:hypothetical protein